MDYTAANRELWDELAGIHAESAFYDVDGFLSGRCTLMPLECQELGDVAGRRLLHLQCHFGLDTLSWARRGAIATGVDFSPRAIDLARGLAERAGLNAEFVCTNVYDLPSVLEGQFDIVFASYGFICWLSDFPRWARIAAGYVRPGGVLYLVEHHPFSVVFDSSPDAEQLDVVFPYFHREEPAAFEADGTYAGPTKLKRPRMSYEWSHPLGDVVSAVAATGLRIEFLHEFPFTNYRALPYLHRGADGWWRLPDAGDTVPLMYSLKATKPSQG